MKKSNKKKKTKLVLTILVLAAAVIAALCAGYIVFGGFGTGCSADVDEFAKYAADIDQIEIPENTEIVALGEATHGNKEFQKLKLDVFRLLVEKYNVRAFALEGDFGGCECVNRYIHGEEGTSEQAAAAIGFAIYRTDEMAELIDWMRDYNSRKNASEQLSFYGFDMQRCDYNYDYLISGAKSFGVDTAGLETLWDGKETSNCSNEKKTEIITSVKNELMQCDGERVDFTVHHADILLQNIELSAAYDSGSMDGIVLRDELMAKNIQWIQKQEEKRGNACIFVSAHNGHVEKNGTYNSLDEKVTGHYLADELGSGYFTIGTDFYKATVNLPKASGKRVNRTFYSRDLLANAAEKSGRDICYLDFTAVPGDSSLRDAVDGYLYMGSLGESYSVLNKILPFTYRVRRTPSETYDALILVTDAHPTEIKTAPED